MIKKKDNRYVLMKEKNFNLKDIRPISINERSEEFDLILWQESFQSDVQKKQSLSLSFSFKDAH